MTYTLIFRPIAGQYSGVGHIPSPGRVLGAVLAGAYRTGNSDVIAAARQLASTSQPRITLPSHGPFFELEQTNVFSAANPMTEDATNDLEKAKSLSLSGTPGGKIGSSRITRIYHDDAFFAYTLGEDAPNRELIAQACEKIAFFGTGADLVTVTVENGAPKGRTFSYLGTKSHVGVELRTWSPSLLAHYDAQYESTFVSRTSAGIASLRIDTGRWVETKRGSDAQNWFVIPTVRPVNPKAIISLTSSIKTETAVPLPDLRGKIRAIAIPESQANNIEIDLTEDRLATSETPHLLTQEMSYWTHPADLRISATPLAGHPDPQVIVWQLEQLGFRVRYISDNPFHYSQGTARQSARPSRPYAAWWVALEGTSEGLIQLGDFTRQGFGLFRPVTQEVFNDCNI